MQIFNRRRRIIVCFKQNCWLVDWVSPLPSKSHEAVQKRGESQKKRGLELAPVLVQSK
jgi:hypothetical protein